MAAPKDHANLDAPKRSPNPVNSQIILLFILCLF